MRYRTRMIILFTAYTLLISIAIGFFSYMYENTWQQSKRKQELEYYAETLIKQFDNDVKYMGFAIDTLVYSVDVLDAMTLLSEVGRGREVSGYSVDKAVATLQTALYAETYKDFYRVILFNRFADAVANRNDGKLPIDASVTWADLNWLDQVTGTRGQNVLIGLHEDDWSAGEPSLVFSLVKEVQGDALGYIEVQYSAEHLSSMLALADTDILVSLYHPDGHLLYTSDQTTARDMRVKCVSDTTQVVCVVALSEGIAQRAALRILYFILAICLVFFILSFVLVRNISSFLTRPIEQVRDLMMHAEYKNMDISARTIESSSQLRAVESILELREVFEAFQDMMMRLSASMDRERQLWELHLRSQFDVLQAQVNPHFLFNVLNMLSQRGMKRGDEEICLMCASLAAMLRYSTDTRQSIASVAAEVNYLERYVYLQKLRFQHRFDCDIVVDEGVKAIQIPKLTLQPLVENSVGHGYDQSAISMRIRVRIAHEAGRLIIEVHDNGQGFQPHVLRALVERFDAVREDLRAGKRPPAIGIGGMGLVNLYARMALYLGERFDMELSNEDGAFVRIWIGDPEEEGA